MTKPRDQGQVPAVAVQAVPPTVYVEGISQLLLGFPNSRLMMFNLATRHPEQPDGPAVHNMACELVMPTPALLEMCKTILNHAAQVSPMLKDGGERWVQQMNDMLDGLSTDQ